MFDGPQIWALVHNEDVVMKMSDKEKVAWVSYVEVIKNFRGYKQADNNEVLVNEMLLAFCDLGCNMSIKVHFLNSHLDQFPENLGAVSDEQGERFHLDLMIIEECYQGRWDRNMM